MNILVLIESSPVFFIGLMGIVGLIFGSFLNVVIHRLPIMMEREWRSECKALLGQEEDGPPAARYDLVVPRSTCPKCGHGITAMENIPLISYAVQGGRCSACGVRISLRYPVVEAMSGAAAAVVAWHFGFGVAAIGAALLSWSLIALAAIDFSTQLLPDAITLPFLWLGVSLNFFDVYTSLEASILGVVFGYLSLWGVYWVFKLVTRKEGMGYGDFKLLAMICAWLGWQALPLVIILASVAGACVGLALIAWRAWDRSKPIPFGPYLACAGWVAMIWGDSISSFYFGGGTAL